MELSSLLRTLRSQFIVAIVVFALVMGLGVVAAYTPDERFETRATVLAVPVPNPNVSRPETLIGFSLESLRAQIQSRAFRARIREIIGEPYDRSPIRLSANSDPTTGLLRITANSTDQAAVAPWANEVVAVITDPTSIEEILPGSDVIFTLRPLDAALPPSEAASPNRPPILVAAALFGFLAAIFAALGMENLARIRNRASTLRSRFGNQILGELPRIPRRTSGANTLQVLANGPPSLIEANQALRTNLELAMAAESPAAVAVISMTMGEGKSTVATSLGSSLAAVGHQVTLVDADLRRPALHKYLDVPIEPGLASAHLSPIGQLLQPVPTAPNLHAVPAGIPSRHPAELMSTNLPLVLDELTGEGRIVIVDAPPIAAAAETAIIAAKVKYLIFVIDARKGDPAEVEEAIMWSHDKGATILGVVLNRSTPPRGRRSSSASYYHDAV